MESFLAFLAVAGGFAAILGTVAWLGTRARRRGVGGGLMGPIDEIYNPGAHRSRQEVQVQAERMVPTPSPDGQWRRIRNRVDTPTAGGGPSPSNPAPRDIT